MLYTIDISEDEVLVLEKFLSKIRPQIQPLISHKEAPKKLSKSEKVKQDWEKYKASKRRRS